MGYPFVTLANYGSPSGAEFDPESRTEQAGYRTMEQMVRTLTEAGERTEDWLKAAYPPQDEALQPLPQYSSQIDAELAQRAINERYLRYQAERSAAAAAKLAEQQAAADAAAAATAKELAELRALKASLDSQASKV